MAGIRRRNRAGTVAMVHAYMDGQVMKFIAIQQRVHWRSSG